MRLQPRICTGVSYRVTLAVGKKVCSFGGPVDGVAPQRVACQHAAPIPALHFPAKSIPTRARLTGSYCACVGKIGVNRKHTTFLLVGGVVVEVDGYGREVSVVVYRNWIGPISFCAKFATGSNDDSCGIANPFVWLQRQSQVIQSADREGETLLPLPIGWIEIELGVRHDNFWKLGMDRNNGWRFRHDVLLMLQDGRGRGQGQYRGGLCKGFPHCHHCRRETDGKSPGITKV